MRVWEFLWKITGQLLIILGIIGILAIHDWLSGVTITMPEEALAYIPPYAGYICCAIVILIGIITLGGWFWNRHPKTIYTLSLLIGLASIIGCYMTHNDTAFKVALSILGISIVILTTLTILIKTYAARNTRKQWRIVITLSVMTVYLILMVGFIFPQWCDAVACSFPDPVLREAVRKEVGKPFGFITQSDLERINHLYVGNWGEKSITQLKGLEKCTGLEKLGLGVNYGLADISPLSNLTNLKHLQISYYFRLNDITPLSNLRQLTYLRLDDNAITDISSLSNLVNLSVLDISTNGIKDISPLSNLVNLSVLDLSSNSIEDINQLAKLTNLTKLDITGNKVTDVSVLSSLSKLTNLNISSNPIRDITALSKLTELKIIFMFSPNISNISPLLSNTGLGSGDKIYLGSSQLDNYSLSVVVPELKSRGVSFYHEGWGLSQ